MFLIIQCFHGCLQVLLLCCFHLCFYVLFTLCSQHSNLLNQARLSVLKSRDDHVKRLTEEAKGRLGEITKDSSRWKKVMQDLIIQVWSLLRVNKTWHCIVHRRSYALKRFLAIDFMSGSLLEREVHEWQGGVTKYVWSIGFTEMTQCKILGRVYVGDFLLTQNPSEHKVVLSLA